MDGWWRKTSSTKVLGHLKECMQSLAKHCLMSVQAPCSSTLQVLSLSDGSMNHCECVPTSVMLAHAFASLGIDTFPAGLERIRIFGADFENPQEVQCLQAQSWMPPWLELQHVCFDNEKDFKPQLYKCGLRPHSVKFDIVLMRQGLCYCQDWSFECWPPEKLNLAGIEGKAGTYGPSGTYILESNFRNGRPSYRNGRFLLHWRPRDDGWNDWVVVEGNEEGKVWANICKDAGSPALALGSWYVWDGYDYMLDKGVSCDVVGSRPWWHPPRACKCCAGISLDAASLQSFIGRVAAVLDEYNPGAFALLHGGYYKGVPVEVEEFHWELEKAAQLFNSRKPHLCASVLRRQESQDTQDDPTRYWNQIEGLLLCVNRA